jgi:hypothetical protein
MAKKLTKRKAFNFLRSYFDVLNEIETDSDKLDYLLAVINKQFLDEDPKDLPFIANLCYESQRHSIETSIKGYKDKTKTDLQGNPLNPIQPPKQDPLQGGLVGGYKDPLQQEEEKEEEEEEEEEQEEEKATEKSEKDFSEEVFTCFVNCLSFFPDHLKPKEEKQRVSWLSDIEKIKRLDKIPFEVLEKIVSFGRKDQFWQKNFLSLLKLRKKNREGVMYLVVLSEAMKSKKGSNGRMTKDEEQQLNREILRELMEGKQ